MKKLLPVTADKVKVNILRRKEEGFIIMVGVISLSTVIHSSYTKGKWSG